MEFKKEVERFTKINVSKLTKGELAELLAELKAFEDTMRHVIGCQDYRYGKEGVFVSLDETNRLKMVVGYYEHQASENIDFYKDYAKKNKKQKLVELATDFIEGIVYWLAAYCVQEVLYRDYKKYESIICILQDMESPYAIWLQ